MLSERDRDHDSDGGSVREGMTSEREIKSFKCDREKRKLTEKKVVPLLVSPWVC